MKTRAQRLSVAAVLALVIAGVLVVGHQSSLARRSADFTIDYSAALLIRQGHPDAIYDRARLGPLMLRISDQAIDPRLPFDAPLSMALPYVPLTYLPLEAAFRVWQAMTIALLVLAIWLLARWLPLGRRAPLIGSVALFGLPATWALLSEGQPSAMLLLGSVLLVGAWLRRSMALAVLAGLLLAMKPQYVPAFLIVLVAARAWKPLLAALLGCVATALSPLLAGGVHGMTAMVSSALDAGQGVIRSNESLIASLAPFLPGSWSTLVGFGLWMLALLALTWSAIVTPHPDPPPQTGVRASPRAGWKGGRETLTAMATLATSASLIVAPHALPHDLVLIAVPLWLAYVLYRRGEIPSPAPAAFAIAAAMVLDLGGHFVNLAPPVMLVCLAVYSLIWFRRRRQTDRLSQAA